jgi:hypothetical protein
MKALPRLVLVAAVAVAAVWYGRHARLGEPADDGGPAIAETVAHQPDLTREASGTALRVAGRVQRLLADDRDGSPHQKFIIVTDSGITLLIAHNIALAPRLEGLATGDTVEVLGEYEWNEKGGLIHWTHKDPQGKHMAGYIEWRGRRYQ